jgi:hypothetical protein
LLPKRLVMRARDESSSARLRLVSPAWSRTLVPFPHFAAQPAQNFFRGLDLASGDLALSHGKYLQQGSGVGLGGHGQSSLSFG